MAAMRDCRGPQPRVSVWVVVRRGMTSQRRICRHFRPLCVDTLWDRKHEFTYAQAVCLRTWAAHPGAATPGPPLDGSSSPSNQSAHDPGGGRVGPDPPCQSAQTARHPQIGRSPMVQQRSSVQTCRHDKSCASGNMNEQGSASSKTVHARGAKRHPNANRAYRKLARCGCGWKTDKSCTRLSSGHLAHRQATGLPRPRWRRMPHRRRCSGHPQSTTRSARR